MIHRDITFPFGPNQFGDVSVTTGYANNIEQSLKFIVLSHPKTIPYAPNTGIRYEYMGGVNEQDYSSESIKSEILRQETRIKEIPKITTKLEENILYIMFDYITYNDVTGHFSTYYQVVT